MLVFFLAGYLIYHFQIISKDKGQISLSRNITINQVLPETLVFSEPKPFDYYAQQLSKKNIFVLPAPLVVKERPNEVITHPKPDPMLFMKNLNLVGIVVDEKPLAVIEDLETKETLFLYSGDHLRDAVVEKITTNKVIFNNQGVLVEIVQQ